MLEAIIAITSLVLGIGIGWWFRSQSAAPAGNPEKVLQLEADLRGAREIATKAETNFANAQSKFEEEKSRLGEIRKELEVSFKAMAADIAKSNSTTFLEQANEKFKALKVGSEQDLEEKKKLIDKSLVGMNDQLESIRKQSTELKTSIDTSQKTTASLREDTTRLREILSSSQKRGQWGERMVEDILKLIGFVEGVNYTRQSQVESGQRPDFTFILHREKKLNMDVKFPLAHYENYIEADSDEARTREKDAFLNDVKKHIKSLSGRDYINPGEGTLEYVMLFIPNESIYGFINSESTALVDDALKNHVLLCSPLTLYAMLSLIHQAARNFTMNERASEVTALVDQFRIQWRKYVDQMDKLSRRIEGLTGDYHELVTTRTRALEKSLDKIEDVPLAIADGTSDEEPKTLE